MSLAVFRLKFFVNLTLGVSLFAIFVRPPLVEPPSQFSSLSYVIQGITGLAALLPLDGKPASENSIKKSVEFPFIQFLRKDLAVKETNAKMAWTVLETLNPFQEFISIKGP